MLRKYVLKNGSLEVHFQNLGGVVTEILDKGVNLLVGTPQDYAGAIIGRVANRISGASYSIQGKRYEFFANDGKNSLHGGKIGLDKVWWDVTEVDALRKYRLTHLSPDGTEGHPGNLTLAVTYSLTDDNEFVIEYEATTDKDTHINLTHHCYFNLSGEAGSTILDHELEIAADEYTEADPDTYIPTGKILSVDGKTDFRKPKELGKDIDVSKDGFNHNFVLRGDEVAAKLTHKKSGRTLEVRTTEPGLMLYTGFYLALPYAGVALEAQHYPDSPNRPEFPPTLLSPGEKYHQRTSYRFQHT
jgi:aldose 1-epimerase